MLRCAIRLGVMVIALSTSAGFLVATSYAHQRLYAIKGVVVDQWGAVIQHAEVVFKGNSGTLVSHTGMDGSVNVNLEAGKYLVTVSAIGFATTELADYSVPAPTAEPFRVILKVNNVPFNGGSPAGDPSILKDVPTRTSLPVAQLATTKRRSMRCLYLWKCSAAHP